MGDKTSLTSHGFSSISSRSLWSRNLKQSFCEYTWSRICSIWFKRRSVWSVCISQLYSSQSSITRCRKLIGSGIVSVVVITWLPAVVSSSLRAYMRAFNIYSSFVSALKLALGSNFFTNDSRCWRCSFIHPCRWGVDASSGVTTICLTCCSFGDLTSNLSLSSGLFITNPQHVDSVVICVCVCVCATIFIGGQLRWPPVVVSLRESL